MKKEDSTEDRNTLGIYDILKAEAPYTFDPEWVKELANKQKARIETCPKCGGVLLVNHTPDGEHRQCSYCDFTKTSR